MLKVLDCTNLIGDSIYLLRPVSVYLAKHTGEDINIVANPGMAFEMFHRCFGHEVPVFSKREMLPTDVEMEILPLQAGLSGEWCFTQRLHINRQPHISEGFAHLLEIEIDTPAPILNWVDEGEPEKEYITVCPFSRSCTRHSGLVPNKTLDDWKWNHLISYFRRQDYPVKVMGAPKDRLENCAVADNDYLCASTLSEVQLELKKSHLVLSVDNGLAHMSSALNIPTIILWPLASHADFIAPLWAPRTSYLQIEPNSVTPAAILSGLRKFTKEIFDGKI